MDELHAVSRVYLTRDVGVALRNVERQAVRFAVYASGGVPKKNMAAADLAARIEAFREDLSKRDAAELVQRHITHGDCFALHEDVFLQLKQAVAENFGIHPSQVVVVGSAKLGFSIVPTKLFRPFSEESDIDIALASSELFDEFWRDVFEYWARGERWPGLDEFRKYHFRGWMRPDKLPAARSFDRGQKWWDFFRELAASGKFGPYKITGALYKNWHFLERYQQVCFAACKRGNMDD